MASRRSRNAALNQARGRTRKDTDATFKKANATDWPFIVAGTYRRELVVLYKQGNYARCGKSFERVVDPERHGELSKYTTQVGLHERFGVRVIITNMASLNKATGARPWEPNYYTKKVMILVDPSDAYWHARLIKKILSHSHASNYVSNAVVALVRTDRKTGLSTNTDVLLGELMHPGMRGKEIYAVVGESSTPVKRPTLPEYVRTKIVCVGTRVMRVPDTGAKPSTVSSGSVAKKKSSRRDRLIRSQLQQGGRASLKPPVAPLEGLAKDLNERIADELYSAAHTVYNETLSKQGSSHKDARKSVSLLIASPLFVSNAVNTALRDDSLYAKADPKAPTAAEYMAKRQINIAELANEFSSRIQPRIAELDAKALFRPLTKPSPSSGRDALIANEAGAPQLRTFTADVAKKAIGEVAIGCGIWDSFKDWVGYNGFTDDGGFNPGPCPDIVGFGSEPYAHHHHLPKLHHVPDRFLIDPHHGHHHHHHDRNEVKQKVIVRVHTGRRAAKKQNTSTKSVTTTDADGKPITVKEVTNVHDGESSSGEEDVLLDRAHRKHKGLAYRHINSDDDDDHHRHGGAHDGDEYNHLPVVGNHHHHKAPAAATTVLKNHTHVDTPNVSISSTTKLKELDHHRYSNFFDILRESGCLDDGTPSVYLALDNTVLNETNARRARAGGVKQFIQRYRVHCPADAHSLSHPHFKHPTIVGGVLMISAAGVHYAAHTASAGAHLILDTAAALKAAALSTVDFFTGHGIHHHHRFIPFPVLHVHFPRHYHIHPNPVSTAVKTVHAAAHHILDPSAHI